MTSQSKYDRILGYYEPQFKTPFETTKALIKVLKDKNLVANGDSVMDIGCASGAIAYSVAKEYSQSKFLGLDYNQTAIDIGHDLLKKYPCPNLNLAFGDWFKLSPELMGKFRGIFNVHTLCTLKEIEPAISALAKLNPEWILIKSLFYPGPLDTFIHIHDHTETVLSNDSPDADFNVFSLTNTQKIFSKHGYSKLEAIPFNIGMNFPQPADGARGTYTRNIEGEPFAQFSGPVYLPWYFVLAKRG